MLYHPHLFAQLGGYSSVAQSKHIFSVCLNKLVSQALAHSAGTNSPSMPLPWQTMAETLGIHSTSLILNEALLAVGGSYSSAIHLSSTNLAVGDGSSLVNCLMNNHAQTVPA